MTNPTSTKALRTVLRPHGRHWVGDGFPVRSLFGYSEHGRLLDPFLLFDYAGPAEFPPTAARRGVGEHPHRGFETVTIVYDGEVEHRDSSGGGGHIGPGDVQWMTAASGLVHEEFHGREWARRGGPFEMVQLWVNLPARDKTAAPGYQALLARDIPRAELLGGGGSARVIAGGLAGARGPARTFTPIQLWDLRLAGGPVELTIPDGYTSALAVLRGSLRAGGAEPIREAEVAVFDRAGTLLRIDAAQGTTALLLAGQPIGEPIVGHGPFVMNRPEEIDEAVRDYQSGRMGHLS
ncbi:MAG: pirin family protein [Deltaproteobacteria bacterium]|nr:pirin family protein [Deltaproteobacteria bacterium]